jgi:predicted enzyme related to lactoylglutathione lyase
MDNQLHPPPEEIDINTGISMWRINEIRIWAMTYEKALIMYNEIIDWKTDDYETTD